MTGKIEGVERRLEQAETGLKISDSWIIGWGVSSNRSGDKEGKRKKKEMQEIKSKC